MKVLVVDDDVSVCEEVCEIADAAGMDSVTATDGQEAWEIFLASDPDIIVTAVRIPVLDGFELVARIRKQRNMVQKYILMMGEITSADLAIQALNSGANDYLLKPLPFEEAIVRLHLARRTVQAALHQMRLVYFQSESYQSQNEIQFSRPASRGCRIFKSGTKGFMLCAIYSLHQDLAMKETSIRFARLQILDRLSSATERKLIISLTTCNFLSPFFWPALNTVLYCL